MSQASVCNDDPSLEHNLKGHKKSVTDLSFHPYTQQLATSSEDDSIMLWNLPLRTDSKSTRCYNFKGHSESVTSITFCSNGQLMASGSLDRTVQFWIPTVKGGSASFLAHSAAVRTVAFSPSDEQLITGSNDKSIKKWDVHTRRFLCSFLGHTNWVRCVQFLPDGHLIASCADDRTVRLWDVGSGQCIHTFTTSKGSGNYLACHSSGNSIAIAMNSGSVRVYDIRKYKLQQHYILHDNTTCVSWHPNGTYLLTSGVDGAIRIVDVMEGRPLYTLKGHNGATNTVKFNKDGDYFASAGADKHVMIWRTNFISQGTPSSSQISI